MLRFLIISICLININGLFAQQDSVIAKVGADVITVNKYRERFELTPQVYGPDRDIQSRKKDLLYSLIAEKLWAQEAENLRLDTTDIIKNTFSAVEKMYIRDALYKAEIENKITISEKELTDAAQKYFIKLNLAVLFSTDSTEIYTLYKKLKTGVSFDSVNSGKAEKIPAMIVSFGDMKKLIEDSLYSLKEGKFTAPYHSKTGWFIFKLIQRLEQPYNSEDINKSLKKITQILKDRKAETYYNSFFNKFFTNKKVNINSSVFWSIIDKIIHVLQHKKKSEAVPDTMNVLVDVNDVLNIENEFGPDTLAMAFINFDKDPFTVKQFLRSFIFEGFYTKNVNPPIIAAKLNSRVKLMIENELFAREGIKRGLQNMPSVKADIKMWRDNYLARLFKDKMMDSVKVTDNEVHNYFLKLNSIEKQRENEVNILEILSDSLEVIQDALNQLKHGADFRSIAAIHTKRAWTKANGGEFGYFSTSMYGDIGRIAATLKKGEIYGPLKVPEGYSLFKLIGKRENKFETHVTFNQSKDKLRKELLFKKRKDFFIKYTVKLADKYGVKIDENLLSRISVDDYKMYVFRYFGFGGRMAAVPITLPFIEWYQPWLNSKKTVP